MKRLLIIGNGISGVTLAREMRKKDSSLQIFVISSETKHFFSRTALMYIYMGHMTYEHTKPYEDSFWEKNRIELIFDRVISVDFNGKKISLKTGTEMFYDILVFAVGSVYNHFSWKGQEAKGVQGLYSYQDLLEFKSNTQHAKQAIIVGGGLIGIEAAEMLLYKKIQVTFLVRETWYWNNVLPNQEAEFISKYIRKHGVNLVLESELDEIISDEKGHVKAIKTKQNELLACDFLCLTVGVRPNIDWLKNTDLKINRGILVNPFLETNITDVYACGDCAEIQYESQTVLEQLWYTGRMQAEALAHTIFGKKTRYHRGHWFNSAKFFDLEYQTYGKVMPQRLAEEAEFYWQSADELKAVHFIFHQLSGEFIGMNSFGIRFRHKIFESFLNQKLSIANVMSNLESALFDSEFSHNDLKLIVSEFSKSFPEFSLMKKKRMWTNSRLLN